MSACSFPATLLNAVPPEKTVRRGYLMCAEARGGSAHDSMSELTPGDRGSLPLVKVGMDSRVGVRAYVKSELRSFGSDF